MKVKEKGPPYEPKQKLKKATTSRQREIDQNQNQQHYPLNQVCVNKKP
jgi:hypothetical protein